jgi:MFS family permease
MDSAEARPRFHGWRIVALAAVAQGLSLPLMSAYGIVATPLIEEFGATAAQLGIGMSLAILATAGVGPLLGFGLDRGPLRTIMLAGVALMFTSVFLLSRGGALWQLAVCFAFATAGMSMYGMLPAQVILVNWFVVRRGAALSYAFLGTSVAAFVVPPATAWLVEGFGWRVAVVAIAASAATLAVPVILRLVKRPEELGQHPDGISAAPSMPPSADEGSAATPPLAWHRDPNFWLIGAGGALAMAVAVASLFLVRHFETLGIARTDAALVPSLMAASGIGGKLAAGWLIDRIDPRAVLAGVLGIHALGWVLVASQTSYPLLLAAAVPLGVGGGGFLPLPPVLLGRCFGREAVGRVGGLHGLLHLPLLLTAAPLVGWLEGVTGSFRLPFLGLAGALLLAAVVFAGLRIPDVEPGR